MGLISDLTANVRLKVKVKVEVQNHHVRPSQCVCRSSPKVVQRDRAKGVRTDSRAGRSQPLRRAWSSRHLQEKSSQPPDSSKLLVASSIDPKQHAPSILGGSSRNSKQQDSLLARDFDLEQFE